MSNQRKYHARVLGINGVILRANAVFSAQYKTSNDPSVLIAQEIFCDSVRKRSLSINEALRQLNDPLRLAQVLLLAQKEYNEEIERHVKERENKIMQIVLKNTNYKAVLLMGLVVAACSQPMTTLYNRVGDALFGKAEDEKKATAPHCPCESANGRPRYFLEPEKGLPVRRVWDHAAFSNPVRVCGS